jgi:glycerol uptake facilitator-like aquaporin
MSPRILKLVGTLFLVIGVFSLMFRVFGGPDFALIPWPVSLIVVAIGVFFLKQGGGVEGWAGRTRNGAGSP